MGTPSLLAPLTSARLRIACTVLGCVLLAGSSAAAQGAADGRVLPFTVGERLTYTAHAGPGLNGTAQMWIEGPAELHGISTMVLRFNYPLVAAMYDAQDHRLQITLGDCTVQGRRLSRSIGGVVGMDVLTDGHGHDVALRVEHGGSHTLLTFAP